MFNRALLAVAAGSLFGCAHTFPDLELSKLPDAKAFPNDAWVTLLDEEQVAFETDPKSKEAVARVTRVLRRRMLKTRAPQQFSAWYDKTFSSVVSIEGRYVLPDGTSHPIDTSKRVDASAAPGSFFDERRVVVVTPPPLPIGAVIEWRVVQLERNLEPWVNHTRFGDDEPISLQRVVVTAPAGWDIAWRCSAMSKPCEFTPTTTTLPQGAQQWVFEKRDLPAVQQEPNGPGINDEVPLLMVRLEKWFDKGEAKQALPTASALSKWLHPRYDERAQPNDAIAAKVKEVLAGVPDEPRAKAKALYEFACRSVQYCAIEVGYGAWIPHDAREVHTQRFGDCKDKANYLRTLLKVAGIESRPTLIYAHSGLPHGFGFASLGANFNHAILAVKLGNETIYADPTWRTVPFGEVPYSDSGATVLELTPEGAELATTPESSAATNTEVQRYTLNVSATGVGSGQFEVTARGLNAVDLTERKLRTAEKAADWVNSRLALRATRVESVEFTEGSEFNLDAVLKGSVMVERLLSRNESGLGLVRLSDIIASDLPSLDGSTRRTPIIHKYLSSQRTSVSLALPAGTRISRVPPPVHVDSKYLTYDLAWSVNGTTVVADRTLAFKQRIVQPSEAQALNASLDEVRIAEADAVVVRGDKP